MINFYNTFLYQPIFNLLIFLYNIIPGKDIGVAIVVLTLIINLILFPLSLKRIKSQKILQELQPKLEELKKKHAHNKEDLSRATMELYRQQKINPFSSCLQLLIQLPFFIAIYQSFQSGLKSANFNLIYNFIGNPGQINTISLNIIDLSQPNVILAGLAAIAQWWSAKMLMTKKSPKIETAKDENMAAIMNKQMIFLMPLLTFYFGLKFPSGLALYWFMTTIITIAQQIYFLNKHEK